MALWVNGSLVWVGPSSKTGGKANPSNWDRLELGSGSDSSTTNYEYCYREGAQYRCNNGGAGGTYQLPGTGVLSVHHKFPDHGHGCDRRLAGGQRTGEEQGR